MQLKMTEETRDSTRRDLIEANRKIREGGIVIFLCCIGIVCGMHCLLH